jgi:hypothetical protein
VTVASPTPETAGAGTDPSDTAAGASTTLEMMLFTGPTDPSDNAGTAVTVDPADTTGAGTSPKESAGTAVTVASLDPVTVGAGTTPTDKAGTAVTVASTDVTAAMLSQGGATSGPGPGRNTTSRRSVQSGQ